MTAKKKRPVLICTEYRGVFFGYSTDTTGDTVRLTDARMAIRWGTEKGVMQLAESGPTEKSKIGAKCDGELRKVTSVFEVTAEAEEKWTTA